MKRIETSRIHNSQRTHALANKPGLPAYQELKPSTLTDHHGQIWGQELWPDCSD
jgi:hypothetical protein